MSILSGPHKFARGTLPVVTLLAVLAVLVTPLLMSLPVYADWGADTRLTNDKGRSILPVIAVSGNNVHVIWYDLRSGEPELYYKRSTDGGGVWGAEIRLGSATGSDSFPSIAVSGDFVHIVWNTKQDGNLEIYYKRSTDGGVTWGTDTRLTNNRKPSLYPSVAASGNNVHVVWQDDRSGYGVFYKCSTDGGVTWGVDTRLTNNKMADGNTSVAVSGDNVHVAYFDYPRLDDHFAILYKHSGDGGVTWGTLGDEIKLSTDPAPAIYPSIAVSGSNIYVSWIDLRGGKPAIYYKYSSDGGVTWGDDTRLSTGAGSSGYPATVASGNNVHVVWYDDRDGNNEIYYKYSSDGGVTWGADTRLTNNSSDSLFPRIAACGNNIYVVWYDNRDGNEEIYCKKLSAPVPAIISFNPISGEGGTRVTITGNDFSGATAVRFGGTEVTNFTVDSDTQITAIVGTGASGAISVTTLSGMGTGASGFTYTGPGNVTNTPSAAAVPSKAEVSPSAISVRNAALSIQKVLPGVPVNVTAEVVNTGTVNEVSIVKLFVNGELENSRSVKVSGGSSVPVLFTIYRSDPGIYTVKVGDAQAGSFTVAQIADSNVVYYIGGALLVIAVILVGFFILRKKRKK